MFDDESTDPLARWLAPPEAGLSAGLRADLRERTSREVGRQAVRRRWRQRGRAALALGIAACLGGLAVYLSVPPEVRIREVERVVTVEVVREVIREVPPETAPVVLAENPDELERAALFKDPPQAAVLWCKAGDIRFGDDGDVAGALRCYRAFLSLADAEQQRPRAGDNWLLTSLKQERRSGP